MLFKNAFYCLTYIHFRLRFFILRHSIKQVIVKVYLSLSSRLSDLRERAKREPWSLNGEDSEQIYSK